MGLAGRGLEVQVRESLPATTEADHLDVVLTATICHTLDHGVEAGDVAAARENADASRCHTDLPGLAGRIGTCVGSWFVSSGTDWGDPPAGRPIVTPYYSAASGLHSSRNWKRFNSADTVSRKPPYSNSE